jgi:hypothetical protein
MVTPLDCPREVWCDHAIVQDTCPTYAQATLKFLQDKKTNLPQDSPAFQKTRGAKLTRFSSIDFRSATPD